LNKIPINISLVDLIEVIIASIFFSYLGNYFSQESILLAPNPGYSLIISKSYVIFTTVAAVFLFNSEITLKNILSIILILVFSSLIVLPSKIKRYLHNKKWVMYSVGAFFCWGFLALMLKHLINKGIEIPVLLSIICLIVSSLIYLEIRKKKISTKLNKEKWFYLILIGVFSTLFNYYMNIGYKYSPNPGYINAINASSITFVTLLSIILFKDEFSYKKIIGVIGTTIGLILLFI
jgi:drug/metabolite transporter (DMT)-like permease